jgi:hypothetical protein
MRDVTADRIINTSTLPAFTDCHAVCCKNRLNWRNGGLVADVVVDGRTVTVWCRLFLKAPLLSFSLPTRNVTNRAASDFSKVRKDRSVHSIASRDVRSGIVLYYRVGLALRFEQREILIVVMFCPFLLCPIASLARIAMSGFFRTELILERCSLDICKE